MERRQDSKDDSLQASLVFSMRGPIPIPLDEQSPSTPSLGTSSAASWSSGASVLDLVFPQPETVSEIRFKNFYTARLTLLVRFDDSVQNAPKREHMAWAAAASLSLARLRGVDSTEGIKIGRNLTGSKSLSDWVVSVQNKELMPDPHSETGSEDRVIIASSDSLVPLHEITALRFLLRQPSPNWKTFSLEDISVFRHPLLSCIPLLSKSLDDEPKEESKLSVLARQTKEALSGKVLRLESSLGEDADDLSNSMTLPSSYDIISLQLV